MTGLAIVDKSRVEFQLGSMFDLFIAVIFSYCLHDVQQIGVPVALYMIIVIPMYEFCLFVVCNSFGFRF